VRIGIIGPTDIHITSKAAGLDPAVCEALARAAGENLARHGHTLVLVPDRGVALLAAETYRAAGGPRLIGILPHGGTSSQTKASRCDDHRGLCHETIEDLYWTEQHERICQQSDVLLCIGLSCGTLSEIAWTKWVGNTPVVVVRSLVSGIPPEMMAETDLYWVENLEDFNRLLGTELAQCFKNQLHCEEAHDVVA
jgi:predicted Rossmann-fold nucleotide-binding protein